MSRLEKLEARLTYIEAELGIGACAELEEEAPAVEKATPAYPSIDEFRGKESPMTWTPGFTVMNLKPWEVAPQHRPERFILPYQDVDKTK